MDNKRKATCIDDEENSVTMVDVLEEENALEEDANAVLGGADDKTCTYNKGYIRQPLYSCKSCVKGRRAALCLGCSLHCHEGHEIIELYTKRHTKCDCGNSKFGDKACSLEMAKSPENAENKYNQNYDGVYCICHRPYPDPEELEPDEMIQCIICEDWYHSKHLGNGENVPSDEDYSEMICQECMKSHEFLWRYASKYAVFKDKISTNDQHDTSEKVDVDVEGTKIECSMPKDEFSNKKGSCFWSEGWRSSLCRCDDCKTVYEEHKISYLLDNSDSIQAYEEAGKQKCKSQYEKGMEALASLDHVQQINAIEGYNAMKDSLKEYLQQFVESKKVVSAEDIQAFFSGMKSQKRQKVDVPSFCR